MSGFSNPIINAGGTLIRNLMKSVNYVAGLAGWQITRDGDAEFNNATIRGDVIIGGDGAPGSPGWLFTENIPAELIAQYPDMVAVQIGFHNSVNVYWYQGILNDAGGTVVSGWYFGGSGDVMETWRHRFNANKTSVQIGYFGNVGEDVEYVFGANGGTYDATQRFIINRSQFVIDVSSHLLMTGELEVGNSALDGYVDYSLGRTTCNANTAVGAANTAIPGTSYVVNVQNTTDRIVVTAGFALSCSVLPTSQMSGNLRVDGTVQGGSAGPWRAVNVNERSMVTGQWQITGLSVGNHTFDLSAVAGVAAQYVVNAGDTYMSVVPKFRKVV